MRDAAWIEAAYQRGFQKLADSSPTPQAARSQEQKEQQPERAEKRTQDSASDEALRTDGKNNNPDSPLDPVFRQTARSSAFLDEHVAQSVELAQAHDDSPPSPTKVPQVVSVPPMLPVPAETLDPLSETCLRAVPGMEELFSQQALLEPNPKRAFSMALAQAFQEGLVESLPPAHQAVFRAAMDVAGFKPEEMMPGGPVDPEMQDVSAEEPQDPMNPEAAMPGTVLREERPGFTNPKAKIRIPPQVAVAGASAPAQPQPGAKGRASLKKQSSEVIKLAKETKKSEDMSFEALMRAAQEDARAAYYGEKETPVAGRVLQAGFGLGSVAAGAPVLGKALRGKPLLWHGTSARAAESILANPDPRLQGILLRFAGKAGRANSWMLANSVVRELTDAGVPLDSQQIQDIVEKAANRIQRTELNELEKRLDQLHERVGLEGKGADALQAFRQKYAPLKGMTFDLHRTPLNDVHAEIAAITPRVQKLRAENVSNIVRDELVEALKRGGASPAQASEVARKFEPKLRSAGMRIYSGVHPATVIGWGSSGTGEMGANKAQENILKKMGPLGRIGGARKDLIRGNYGSVAQRAYLMGNVLTGNIPDQLLEWTEMAAYRPKRRPPVLTNVSAEIVARHIREMRESGKNPYIVLGSRMKPVDFDYMRDFPGLRSTTAALPSLKGVLAQIMPNYDPGRDISTFADVPLENIKHVDVIDPDTAHIRRFNLKEYKAPKVGLGLRLKAVKKMAIPTAILAMGVDQAQAAIRGRHSGLSQLLASKEVRETRQKNWEKLQAEKAREAARQLKKQSAEKAGLPVYRGPQVGQFRTHGIPLPKGRSVALASLAGYLGSLGLGSIAPIAATRYIHRKLNPDDDKGIVNTAVREAKRQFVGGVGSTVGALGSLVGTAIPSLLYANRGKAIQAVAPLLGGYLGFSTAATTPAVAQQIMKGQPPESLGPLEAAIFSRPKMRELLEKHPEMAMLPTAAIMGGAAAGIPYVLGRYYPGITAKLQNKLLHSAEMAMAQGVPLARRPPPISAAVLGIDPKKVRTRVDMKTLHRMKTMQLHPDKATGPDDRIRRHEAMTAINRAMENVRGSFWYKKLPEA